MLASEHRDARAAFRWADVRDGAPTLSELDLSSWNAPFHDARHRGSHIPIRFVKRASEALRVRWRLLADRQSALAYEEVMRAAFSARRLKIETGGYKIYVARK